MSYGSLKLLDCITENALFNLCNFNAFSLLKNTNWLTEQKKKRMKKKKEVLGEKWAVHIKVGPFPRNYSLIFRFKF